MSTFRIASLVIVSTVVSGCANLNQLARDEQQIPITVHNDQTVLKEAGAIYLFPPYSSAVVIDGKGNRCVLTAAGSKSISATSEGALKIGEALDKIKGLEASVKSELIESFTKLNTADNHAAFADIALFHLCLLDQNGTFKNKDDEGSDTTAKAKIVMDAYLKTIEAARSLGQEKKASE